LIIYCYAAVAQAFHHSLAHVRDVPEVLDTHHNVCTPDLLRGFFGKYYGKLSPRRTQQLAQFACLGHEHGTWYRTAEDWVHGGSIGAP
jgi:hypothetical protein